MLLHLPLTFQVSFAQVNREAYEVVTSTPRYQVLKELQKHRAYDPQRGGNLAECIMRARSKPQCIKSVFLNLALSEVSARCCFDHPSAVSYLLPALMVGFRIVRF